MNDLIVALDNIGDTILSLSLYNALKKEPGVRVSFWTKKYSKDIIPLFGSGIPHFYCDPFWTGSPGSGKGGFVSFFSEFLKIRAARFDAALVLNSNWRKNLFCLLAGIRRRLVFSGPFGTEKISPSPDERHVLDCYRQMASVLLGRELGRLSCEMSGPIPPGPKDLEEVMSKGEWAVVHPFSGDPRRNLPLNRWPEIIRHLVKTGFKIYVNAREPEKKLFLSAIGEEISLSGKYLFFSCDYLDSLPVLARVLSLSKIFIGNDSSPLHLASAVGTPCIGILSLRNAKLIRPLGRFEAHIVTFKKSSEEISVEKVIREIDGVLWRRCQATDINEHTGD